MTKRIAMIGAGWVSQHHLQSYRQLAHRGQVVAIADPNPANREERAREFGIDRVYADAAEMLAAGGFDAVDIVSPRELHVQHVLMCAESGLPVMCQKPLAPDLKSARELVANVEGRIRLMVHENWRWRPHYRTIREWLDAGLIGDPVYTQMNLLSSGLIADSSGALPALVRQPMLKTLDRLVIMEIMIHHIDCLRFLLGDLEPVYARYGRICAQVLGEDNAVLTLKTANGGTANVVANLSAFGHDPVLRDHFEINGTRGTIRLTANGLDLFGHKRHTKTFDHDADYAASYLAAIDHFLSCLTDGSAFETAPEDNLKTLEIVDRAYSMGKVHAKHA